MTQRKQFNIALSDWQISEVERQAKLLGIKRTDLIVRWVTAHIRDEQDKNVKPVFTPTPYEPAKHNTNLIDDDEDYLKFLPDLPN
jgi:hypothetical protein